MKKNRLSLFMMILVLLLILAGCTSGGEEKVDAGDLARDYIQHMLNYDTYGELPLPAMPTDPADQVEASAAAYKAFYQSFYDFYDERYLLDFDMFCQSFLTTTGYNFLRLAAWERVITGIEVTSIEQIESKAMEDKATDIGYQYETYRVSYTLQTTLGERAVEDTFIFHITQTEDGPKFKVAELDYNAGSEKGLYSVVIEYAKAGIL